MVMDGYYVHDRKPELWTKINALHLSYLEMPENPQKLEHKIKLDDCIKKFLCVAPHNQKFCFKQTAEVLHRSANSKKDFSGYKAASGWTAIGMYAGNLISQPWRQEYREIKTYCGFYKHQIESNLVGAEIMFEAMGYKPNGKGILILEGPVCPDAVKYLSQDSLVAYVECQILKEIWEAVSASYKVTWLDVLAFRETHLCSPKKAIEGLKYQIQQQQYQEQHRSYHQSNEYITNSCRYPNHLHQNVSSPTLTPNHSCPPGHAHVPMGIPQPILSQCMYNNGYYQSNYSTYGMIPSVCNLPPSTSIYGHMAKQPYSGGYYFNGYIPQPYVMPVPTAQLIEIEQQHLKQNCDITDGISKSQSGNCNNSDENFNKSTLDVKVNNSPKTSAKDEVTGTFESWDYVYRNLESQGYSKDLGERGDVLTVNRNDCKTKNHELKVIERPMKINEALEKIKLFDKPKTINDNIDSKISNEAVSSSYDNLSTPELVKRVTNSIKAKHYNIGERCADSDTQLQHMSKTVDAKKLKINQSKKPVEFIQKACGTKDLDKWQCSSCTYLNDNSKKICDICSKSKIIFNQEMEIGGSECSKCTLVNPKSNKVCEACNTTLQNSPTYI